MDAWNGLHEMWFDSELSQRSGDCHRGWGRTMLGEHTLLETRGVNVFQIALLLCRF